MVLLLLRGHRGPRFQWISSAGSTPACCHPFPSLPTACSPSTPSLRTGSVRQPPPPSPAAVLEVLSVTILLPCWLYCLKISLRWALSLPPPHFTSPASGSACGRAPILQTHSCDGPFHGSRTLDGHASSRLCSHAASSALRETRTTVRGRGGLYPVSGSLPLAAPSAA